MEQEIDYESLFQMAKLETENLQRQVDHWELKAGMLRQLVEQQERLAAEVEVKVELLRSGAIDLKKLSL
ncbi:hypothetical protein ABIE26_002837 [Pedobacter africanus]|uniref:Uncharacterized protein n=1 Tax=Pedobacter africanus TaxID=151894 RepID=A0ACC6KWQ6_9SPHI|nr:hypothetical protein [Pedobacter africanus]MDR6783774.1 hypothetical protein [Pedobacter africanus]